MLQLIEAEGGKRRVETEAAELPLFEERILTAGHCGAVLPAVVLTVNGRRLIQYDTAGFLRFADYPFRHLDEVLGVLQETLLLLLEAEDFLLCADKFALCGETLFVDAKSRRPGLLYGASRAERAGFAAGFASLLALSQKWEHITGLPAAVRRIEERVHLENPDIGSLLRIVETVRREWNYIHPSSRAKDAPG
ncbi:MAG: DUF6382 domain-containing protein [Clostridiales Family XIII bacterium]|jgi:hypothetical protein|nr:DUF6382 domain-containing protein [Clostridiales Family XIII bacterium]